MTIFDNQTNFLKVTWLFFNAKIEPWRSRDCKWQNIIWRVTWLFSMIKFTFKDYVTVF